MVGGWVRRGRRKNKERRGKSEGEGGGVFLAKKPDAWIEESGREEY